MPEPLDHYRALVSALARLVGGHRSGRIPAGDQFPVDMQTAQVGERAPISPEKLDRRLDQLADFAEASPGLLPANVRSPQFISRLRNDAPRFLENEPAVWSYLADHPDYIALCHWNANVDNAWFWRDSDNALHCGLLDWGCAGQMNVAMALWGAMSGAETDLWDRHLDELLRLFVFGDTRLRRARSQRDRTAQPGHALRRDHDGRLATRHSSVDPLTLRRRRSHHDQKRPSHQRRRKCPSPVADADQCAEPLGDTAIRRSSRQDAIAMMGWRSAHRAPRR